jgi:hypothetical protein
MAAFVLGESKEGPMTMRSFGQEGLQFANQGVETIELAFPNYKYRPAHFPQFSAGSGVANFIAEQFRFPILNPRAGQPSSGAAGMHMPEASVNKDDFGLRGEHNIRASRQIGSMEPKTEAGLMKETSNLALRLRILALNAPHVLASAVWCYVVHRLYALSNHECQLGKRLCK